MKVEIRVLVSVGAPADKVPPLEKMKRLIVFTDEIDSIDLSSYDKTRVFDDMQEMCCRPTLMVTGAWGTPYDCPVTVDSETYYKRYRRYDWPTGKSFWMCVEMSALQYAEFARKGC